jgi:hypothetical protein
VAERGPPSLQGDLAEVVARAEGGVVDAFYAVELAEHIARQMAP